MLCYHKNVGFTADFYYQRYQFKLFYHQCCVQTIELICAREHVIIIFDAQVEVKLSSSPSESSIPGRSQPQFTYDQVKHIADLLSSKSSFAPKIGIICGTGLGGLADTLTEKTFVDYEDIPDFPVSTGEAVS